MVMSHSGDKILILLKSCLNLNILLKLEYHPNYLVSKISKKKRP